MNLILLSADDFVSSNRARLHDARRVQHILQIHKARVGDQLKVGMLNGLMGTAEVTAVGDQEVVLETFLQQQPPSPLPLRLILALPRPKMLKRILQNCATLGVKEIILINSYRVEKSYWQTPILDAESIREHLILGLEQGGDTMMPELRQVKRFKPFVEDELPLLIQGSRALVAHPYTQLACPRQVDGAVTLAIGPEGGFIPYEVDLLSRCGFEAVHLGERILRVDTAIPFIISRLF